MKEGRKSRAYVRHFPQHEEKKEKKEIERLLPNFHVHGKRVPDWATDPTGRGVSAQCKEDNPVRGRREGKKKETGLAGGFNWWNLLTQGISMKFTRRKKKTRSPALATTNKKKGKERTRPPDLTSRCMGGPQLTLPSIQRGRNERSSLANGKLTGDSRRGRRPASVTCVLSGQKKNSKQELKSANA